MDHYLPKVNTGAAGFVSAGFWVGSVGAGASNLGGAGASSFGAGASGLGAALVFASRFARICAMSCSSRRRFAAWSSALRAGDKGDGDAA